ncbi:MAG: hypothetical protein LIO54_05145 [Oscillospiraceae bacterium]|nr:hypothetical protein [Oscillospiraceae bacterium]
MDVAFDGIGERAVTFLNDGAESGAVVKVCGAGTVGPCSAGDCFDGVALFAENGVAAVRLRGFASVAYSGTTPEIGHNALCADGAGGVCVDAGGADYLAVATDESAGTVTILL